MSSADSENAEDIKDNTKLQTQSRLLSERMKELIYQLQKASEFNQILHDKIIILKEEVRILKRTLREKITDLRHTAENILKELKKM